MNNIPTQRLPEPDLVYRTWEEAGFGPDIVVDLGDGTSIPLRELLGETSEEPHE